MGFGDKLKDLKKQAQESVAEHKDQLHDALDTASVAVDRKTHGKHTARIAKFGQKASDALDKLGGDEPPQTAEATAEPRAAGAEPTAEAHEPA